jgi:branched-chain amino acid transport system substrate-binding protein
MKCKIACIVLAILLISSIMSGCVNKAEPPQIVIGAIVPLTGDYDYFGIVAREVIELGLPEAGKNIKVVYEDSAGDSDKAITALDKLVKKDKAAVIITTLSWVSNSIYPLATDMGVVQATLASAAFNRTQETDNTVSFTAPVIDEVEYLSQYLQKFNRIGVIYMNNDFGKVWDAQLKNKLPDRVIASESYDILLEAPFVGAEQIRQDLLRIKAKMPDVLVCFSIGNQAAVIAREAHGLGLNVQLVGTRPIATAELLDGGQAVEGLVFTYPSYDTNHPIVKRYETAYHKQFTVNGAEAYDCFMTIVQATKEYGMNPANIHNWYLNREYYGALGRIIFDNKANAHYSFVLQKVLKGKFVPYQ